MIAYLLFIKYVTLMLHVNGLFDRKDIPSKPLSTLLLTSVKGDFWMFPVLQFKKKKDPNNKNTESDEKIQAFIFFKKKDKNKYGLTD